MNGQKNLRRLLLLASAIVAVSCNNAPTKEGGSAKSYKLLTTELSNTSVPRSYPASIKGINSVDIRPQITGVITKVLISEGAEVKRGERLFILDQRPYVAALNEAKANVESAESSVATAQLNVESGEELFAESVISENELMTLRNTLLSAQATLAQAEAQKASAESDLSYSVITSPVDGVAGMTSYRVGSLVSPTSTDALVSVTNNDRMYAYFSLSESQLLALLRESGSTKELLKSFPAVELILRDGSTYDQKGRIDAISGVIDQSTGSVSVRATFDNPNDILRDGGSGSIVIYNNHEGVVVIPKIATYEIQDKIFVFRVKDGRAVSTQIKVYPVDNGRDYIVTSGLSAGETIVAEGAGLLREGAVVVSE